MKNTGVWKLSIFGYIAKLIENEKVGLKLTPAPKHFPNRLQTTLEPPTGLPRWGKDHNTITKRLRG